MSPYILINNQIRPPIQKNELYIGYFHILKLAPLGQNHGSAPRGKRCWRRAFSGPKPKAMLHLQQSVGPITYSLSSLWRWSFGSSFLMFKFGLEIGKSIWEMRGPTFSRHVKAQNIVLWSTKLPCKLCVKCNPMQLSLLLGLEWKGQLHLYI
jgi:hypothetical protein